MRRLLKSPYDRVICGVCGGIGAYLGVDSNLVRAVFVLLTVMGGTGFLLYLACALVMPQG